MTFTGPDIATAHVTGFDSHLMFTYRLTSAIEFHTRMQFFVKDPL